MTMKESFEKLVAYCGDQITKEEAEECRKAMHSVFTEDELKAPLVDYFDVVTKDNIFKNKDDVITLD